jgi:uncharacterized YigZ family protein
MATKNTDVEDTFLTLSRTSEGLYKEKGSKFIAFGMPVEDEMEIKAHLDTLRKKYWDARHHCYAYVLGKEGTLYRANDDGEPNHSAGDPILGQIKSHQLRNVLIVVIRYFGGIKLGVGGLIHAYREAALEAIKNNEIVEKTVQKSIAIQFDYLQMNEVMKIVKELDAKILDQSFENRCQIKINIREKLYAELMEKLANMENIEIKVD